MNLLASQESVMAVVDLLRVHTRFQDLFVPYIREGLRRHEALAAGTNTP